MRVHLSQFHLSVVTRFIRFRPDLESPYDPETLDDWIEDERFIHAQEHHEIAAAQASFRDCLLYHDSIDDSIRIDEYELAHQEEYLHYSTYDPESSFHDGDEPSLPPSRDYPPPYFTTHDELWHPYEPWSPELSFFSLRLQPVERICT